MGGGEIGSNVKRRVLIDDLKIEFSRFLRFEVKYIEDMNRMQRFKFTLEQKKKGYETNLKIKKQTIKSRNYGVTGFFPNNKVTHVMVSFTTKMQK